MVLPRFVIPRVLEYPTLIGQPDQVVEDRCRRRPGRRHTATRSLINRSAS
jgi:hypothetical protein